MKIQRTLVVNQPLSRVYAFMADFTTTTEWDPGTVVTKRVRGDGGVGTTYLNTSRFLGRETKLTYVVEERQDQERIRLRGENKSVVARDTIEFRSEGLGTEVTYTAEFEFKGLAKLASPFLRPALTKLGNEAEVGIRDALSKL